MPPKNIKKITPVDNPFNRWKSEEVITPGRFELWYGEPGSRKTTTAAYAPNPLFVATHDELGILAALDAGTVPESIKDHTIILPVSSSDIQPHGDPAWVAMIQIMDHFLTGDHDRRTLIIDTGSGLQSACHRHCASVMFDQDMNNPKGFMNYYAGYLKAAEQFWNGDFLSRCNAIISKGYNIILVCHCITTKVPNLGGVEYEAYSPALMKGTNKENIYDYTMKTCSAVMYFGAQTTVSTDQDSKRKSVAGKTHFIGLNDEGWYKAKNWYGLRDEVDMGDTPKETWDALNAVLPMT